MHSVIKRLSFFMYIRKRLLISLNNYFLLINAAFIILKRISIMYEYIVY